MFNLSTVIVTAICMLLSTAVMAGSEHARCFINTAKQYSVDPFLSYAIAWQESCFNVNARSAKNSDGSYDIGLMQINSAELPALRREGIYESDLYDGCTNIKVGTRIFARKVAKFGQTWKSVGAYNASKSHKQQHYVDQVSRKYYQLVAIKFDPTNLVLDGSFCKHHKFNLPRHIAPPSPKQAPISTEFSRIGGVS